MVNHSHGLLEVLLEERCHVRGPWSSQQSGEGRDAHAHQHIQPPTSTSLPPMRLVISIAEIIWNPLIVPGTSLLCTCTPLRSSAHSLG